MQKIEGHNQRISVFFPVFSPLAAGWPGAEKRRPRSTDFRVFSITVSKAISMAISMRCSGCHRRGSEVCRRCSENHEKLLDTIRKTTKLIGNTLDNHKKLMWESKKHGGNFGKTKEMRWENPRKS